MSENGIDIEIDNEIPLQVCTFFHFFCGPYDEEYYEDQEDFDPALYGTLPQTFFTGICFNLTRSMLHVCLRVELS